MPVLTEILTERFKMLNLAARWGWNNCCVYATSQLLTLLQANSTYYDTGKVCRGCQQQYKWELCLMLTPELWFSSSMSNIWAWLVDFSVIRGLENYWTVPLLKFEGLPNYSIIMQLINAWWKVSYHAGLASELIGDFFAFHTCERNFTATPLES